MQAASLLLLLIAGIVALALGQIVIAAILFLALIVFLAFFLLAKTASGAKKTAKSLSKGITDDLEKAKGQSPKGVAEIGKMFEAAGAKTGEAVWAKDKTTYRSEDLLGRIGTASKNLLDGLGKLFK